MQNQPKGNRFHKTGVRLLYLLVSRWPQIELQRLTQECTQNTQKHIQPRFEDELKQRKNCRLTQQINVWNEWEKP